MRTGLGSCNYGEWMGLEGLQNGAQRVEPSWFKLGTFEYKTLDQIWPGDGLGKGNHVPDITVCFEHIEVFPGNMMTRCMDSQECGMCSKQLITTHLCTTTVWSIKNVESSRSGWSDLLMVSTR